jgi:LacI family transcriptional regulator
MKTIYDIAKEAGYSTATVSKVLNGYKGVSSAARKKILQVVKENNFVPNANAKTLLSGKSYLLGITTLASPNDLLSPFLSEVISSFKFESEKKGYDIIFLSNKIGKNKVTYVEHCLTRNLDGILLAVAEGDYPSELAKRFMELVEYDIPKVSVQGIYPNVDFVLSDNTNAAIAGLEYLYSLGHREIGLVNVTGISLASVQRTEGYREFLELHGLPFREEYVFSAESYTGNAGLKIAGAVAEQKNLTAIFCIFDEVTAGLMQGLRKLGISIPNDISVLSFDDLPLAKYMGLTTMRQYRKEIGALAAKKLIEIIESGEESKRGNILMDTKLVIRSTCKKLKL